MEFEELYAFLCSERQRLEANLQEAETMLKRDPDRFTFERYMLCRHRFEYFLDLEKSLSFLLDLYS